ncbi:MAG: hypothetical protein JXB38_22580 [Anaerolineales bacterium]|nr:hypothetical protein [Anaerolineales bacterium]
MTKYYSGLEVYEYHSYPPMPYTGKNWRILLEKPIHGSFGSTFILNDQKYPVMEVVIEADSVNIATQVLDLIKAALCLINSFDGDYNFIPLTKEQLIDSQHKEYIGRSKTTQPYILFACQIAVKSSFRKHYQHALFKHYVSHINFPTDPHILDPYHWRHEKYANSSSFILPSRLDQVKAASAIILCYSAIEELGLEIRASSSNPSTINGEWNPKIYDELVDRLTRKNINVLDKYIWVIRDTPTKIEKTRKNPKGEKAPWSSYNIRDRNVSVADAILYASFLRSKVASHKLKDIANSLNYYHVHNVQDLARRLILETFGYWKNFPEVISPEAVYYF